MVVAISRGAFTPQKIHSDSRSSSSFEMHATTECFKVRKMAIYHQLLYGASEEEQRASVILVSTIMINLRMPRGLKIVCNLFILIWNTPP